MKIIFLGTGASGGTPGLGKSKRLESSLLIQNKVNILIDASRDFPKQVKNITEIHAVLLTHGHMDACGGTNKLPVGTSIFAHPKTLETITRKFKLQDYKLIPAKEGQKIRINPWTVIPYEVPHAKNQKFPTFAWKLKGEKTVIYASDIAKLTEKFKKICEDADLLIIDGATWKRKIFSHLQADKDLPVLCRLNVDKIILTQIGKSAPSHEQYKKELAKICSKAFPAYDGLRISI